MARNGKKIIAFLEVERQEFSGSTSKETASYPETSLPFIPFRDGENSTRHTDRLEDLRFQGV
jgi:hypothetical protein